MKLKPPMVESRCPDPRGNLAAWLAEWERIHPAMRWVIGYIWFVSVFGAIGAGFAIGEIVLQ